MPRSKQLILTLTLALIGTTQLPAALTLTVDRNTGAWDFTASSDIDVRFFSLIGAHDAYWLGSPGSGALATSFASFSYSGTYNSAPVSGVGTASFTPVIPSGAARDFRLNFGNTTITSPGTFTSFTLVPTSNFDNASGYNAAVDGIIPARGPNTNDPVNVMVVPEPSGVLLLLLGSLTLLWRRNRQ